MSKRVVTYQSPTRATLNICTDCAARMADGWPKDATGQEYCTVSIGLHLGDCDTCDPIADYLDPDNWEATC